ncbi:MAG: hypothetical protein ACPG2Y_01215 [Acholeplasmataceae bacterium]
MAQQQQGTTAPAKQTARSATLSARLWIEKTFEHGTPQTKRLIKDTINKYLNWDKPNADAPLTSQLTNIYWYSSRKISLPSLKKEIDEEMKKFPRVYKMRR